PLGAGVIVHQGPGRHARDGKAVRLASAGAAPFPHARTVRTRTLCGEGMAGSLREVAQAGISFREGVSRTRRIHGVIARFNRATQ
ncbi:MAG: hypothetical protein ACR2OX_00785, partial [Methyloligellaceae bacterium]